MFTLLENDKRSDGVFALSEVVATDPTDGKLIYFFGGPPFPLPVIVEMEERKRVSDFAGGHCSVHGMLGAFFPDMMSLMTILFMRRKVRAGRACNQIEKGEHDNLTDEPSIAHHINSITL